MSNLLLFALICLVALLLIRRLQSPRPERRRPTPGASDPSSGRQAASEEEIVDVSFQDCPPEKPGGAEEP